MNQLKIKKVLISALIMVLIFFTFTNVSNALFDSEEEKQSDIEETIDKDDGGMFEKIIAKMIRRNCRNSI